VAQRIVRAKRTLTEKQIPYEVPRGEALAARLESVLEVIYLIFNEGYTATAGDDWMRPALCDDALRLGRVLAGLMPGEAEVHGLVSLMEIQASRARARTGPAGEPVRLLEQDRTKWDRLLIGRGLSALERAESLRPERGRYALQAAIAACHARAVRPKTRLAAHRGALRGARAPGAIAGRELNLAWRWRWRRARRRGWSWSTRWWRAARWRATTCSRGARRSAGKAGAARRSARGVRTLGIAHAERTRTRPAPGTRPRVRARE